MPSERRFKGALSEEYNLLRLAMPHFDELQRRVGEAVTAFVSLDLARPIQVLDLGCGSGVTSDTILTSRNDIFLTALDNEEKMLQQASANLRDYIQEGRCRLVLQDALEWLREQPAASLDLVASALTLHNMHHAYRSRLHREIFRVLKTGGLFINADKYAPDDNQRFHALQVALERFFDAFVPLGKTAVLKEWILHNVADQAPDRVMKEEDAVGELTAIGFNPLEVKGRNNMEAVLIARKP